MKKYLLIAFACIAAFSCSKDYINDVWNGSDSKGNRPGEAYIRQITEYLLVDNLKELEQAIYLDSLNQASDKHYAKTGASIRTIGSKWVLKDNDRGLEGLELSMTADSTWQLKRNADYTFKDSRNESFSYPTSYTITARQQHDSLGRSRGHCAWRLSITGTRNEGYKGHGYQAAFQTQPDFLYKGGKLGWWAHCKGVLQMDVTKNGNYVDRCTIEYNGGQHDYIYLRGL